MENDNKSCAAAATPNAGEQLESEGKEFTVSVAVTGRYYVSVFVQNDVADEMQKDEIVKSILKKANDAVVNADFGELADIDWEVRCIEDDNENVVFENGG